MPLTPILQSLPTSAPRWHLIFNLGRPEEWIYHPPTPHDPSLLPELALTLAKCVRTYLSHIRPPAPRPVLRDLSGSFSWPFFLEFQK